MSLERFSSNIKKNYIINDYILLNDMIAKSG